MEKSGRFSATIAALIDQENQPPLYSEQLLGADLWQPDWQLLGTSVLTDASSPEADGQLISKKRVYGGAALREEKARAQSVWYVLVQE